MSENYSAFEFLFSFALESGFLVLRLYGNPFTGTFLKDLIVLDIFHYLCGKLPDGEQKRFNKVF